MNIWCCAALALGGGDPLPDLPFPSSPPTPVLEAKPVLESVVREEKPCEGCGGQVKPRRPIARTAVPPAAAEQIDPPTTVVQSSGPVAVELPRRAMTPTYAPSAPAPVYPDQRVQQFEAQRGHQYPSYSYAASPTVEKAPWWKRLFGGSRQISPSMVTMHDGQVPMSGRTAAAMPSTAGRVLQRETWRTQQMTPVHQTEAQVVTMPTTQSQASQQVLVNPPQSQQPVQSAARQTYTTRKPVPTTTTMIRDASVWQYSTSRDSTPTSYSQKGVDKQTPPATVELPDVPPQAPAPASAPLPSWTDDVIAKTIEHSTKAAPVAAPVAPKTTQGVVLPETNAEGQTIKGRVAKTYAGGGGWLLKAESGREYFLKGDDGVLRFRHGDCVEVTGVVKPSNVLGISSVDVEKVSFSAKR